MSAVATGDPVSLGQHQREVQRYQRKMQLLSRVVTPQMAMNAAQIAATYPELPGGVVAASALSGIPPTAPELQDVATAVTLNRLEQKDANTSKIFGNETFLDNVLYDPLKGLVRWGMLLLSAPIEELETLVVRGGVAAATGQPLDEIGGSGLRYAVNELVHGRPVNLGQGWLPSQDLSPEAQAAMEQGASVEDVMQFDSQKELGLPNYLAAEEARSRTKLNLGQENETTVSLGRLAAIGISEPGTQTFHYLSGTVDFAKQIFLDPANIAGGWLAKGRKVANLPVRGLDDIADAFATTGKYLDENVLLNSTRKTFKPQSWGQYLTTKEGRQYMNWFAQQKGAEGKANMYRLFRGTQDRPVDPRVVNALEEADTVDDVFRILVDPEATGGGVNTINRTFGGGTLGEKIGENLSMGLRFRNRTAYVAPGAVGDAVPKLIPGQANWRANGTFLGRMAAVTNSKTLYTADPTAAITTYDNFLQQLTLPRNVQDELLGEAMDLEIGNAGQWSRAVRNAWARFRDDLLEKNPDMVADDVDDLLKSLDIDTELRNYFKSQAGNEIFTPVSRTKVINGGEDTIVLPTAQLESQFLQGNVPLPDGREVRKLIMDTSLASHKATKFLTSESAQFIRGMTRTMMDFGVSKIWKPLQLMRVAWTLRVIGDEQARMAADGLVSSFRHPLQFLSMAFGEKEFSRLVIDAAGDKWTLNAMYREALGRRGHLLPGGAIGGSKAGMRTITLGEAAAGSRAHRQGAAGFIIKVNQLSQDQIASEIAGSILAAQADNVNAKIADVTDDVLTQIKDRFWKGDLRHVRKRLMRDGETWKNLSVRSAADDYIDATNAHIHLAANGRLVYRDPTRGGGFFDAMTDQPVDIGDMPLPGRNVPREEAFQASANLSTSMGGRGDVTPAQIDEMIQSLLDMTFEDPMLIDETIKTVRKWVDSLERDAFVVPADEIAHMRQELEFFVDEMQSDFAGDVAEDMAHTVGGWLDRYGDATPRGQMATENEFALAGDINRSPDDVLNEWRDTAMEGGAIGRKPSDTPFIAADEAAAMPDTQILEQATDMLGGEWTFLSTPYPGWENTPGFHTVALPDAPVYMNIGGEPQMMNGRTFQMVHDGQAVGSVTAVFDDSGRYMGLQSIAVAVDSPVDRPYAWILSKLVADGHLDPGDLVEGFFHGVPYKEWVQRISETVGRELDDIAGSDVMIEAIEASITQGTLDPRIHKFGANLSEYLTDVDDLSANAVGSAALEYMDELTELQMADDITFYALAREQDAERILRNHPSEWHQSGRNYQVIEEGAHINRVMEAVATGKIDDIDITSLANLDKTNTKAVTHVANSDWFNDGSLWGSQVPYPVENPMDGKMMDRVIDNLYALFMGMPTAKFSRSPAYRQFHWDNATYIGLNGGSAEIQAQLVENAIKAKIINPDGSVGRGLGEVSRNIRALGGSETVVDDIVNRLRKMMSDADTAGEGIDNIHELTELAHAYALQKTKGLLYDQSIGHNWSDMARWVSPFAEAWWEVTSTWAKIMADNPRMLRRLQQGIEGARRSNPFAGVGQDGEQDRGWFSYNDFGDEVFMVPGSQLLSKFMLGVDDTAQVEFTGRASALSMVGEIVPGLGPVAQIPLSTMGWTKDPAYQWLNDVLMPFGASPVDVNDPSTWQKAALPTWVVRAMQAVGGGDPDAKRLYANTTIDAARYLMQNEYAGIETPEEYEEMMKKAGDLASRIYIVRAFSAFATPTAAAPQFNARTMGDELWSYANLGWAYSRILEEVQGDEVQAFGIFTNMFGADPSLFSTAKTIRIQPRAVTLAAYEWENDNKDLYEADKFPLTAYYARPDDLDDPFDYALYMDQLDDEREALTPHQWAQRRNQFLGRISYMNQQRRMERMQVPTEQRNAYLRAVRSQLMAFFPGYNTTIEGLPERASIDDKILELYNWQNDERLASSETGQALSQYLAERDKVIALTMSQLGYTSPTGWRNGKRAAQYRAYLKRVGEELVKDYPTFLYLWEQILSDETEESQTLNTPINLAGVEF